MWHRSPLANVRLQVTLVIFNFEKDLSVVQLLPDLSRVFLWAVMMLGYISDELFQNTLRFEIQNFQYV